MKDPRANNNQTHISPEGGQPSSSAGKVNERFPYGTHYDSATSPNAQNMRETDPDIPLMSDNARVDLSTDPLSGLDEQNDTGSCTGAEFGGYTRYSNGYTGNKEEIKAENTIFAAQSAHQKPASGTNNTSSTRGSSGSPAKESRRHQMMGLYLAVAVSAAAIGAVGWLASSELPISSGDSSLPPSMTAENDTKHPAEPSAGDTPVDVSQENIPKTENFVITYEKDGDAGKEQTADIGPSEAAENPAAPDETQTAQLPETDSAPSAEIPEDAAATGSASVSTPSTPTSFVLPVGTSGAVTQPFSCGELVKSKTLGEWRTHDGIDFAAKEGDSVVSIADGLVESVTNDARWGNTVVIGYGDYTAYYYGLGDQISVQAGDSVTAGQALGQIGNSSLVEASEASHLHLGIKKDGSWIDPALLLGLDDGDPAAGTGEETAPSNEETESSQN